MMTMKAFLPAAIVLAALSGAAIEPAFAGGRPAARAAKANDAPMKDCTRVNGRYGYYGNAFCTPAEQLRFDKWEARRWGR